MTYLIVSKIHDIHHQLIWRGRLYRLIFQNCANDLHKFLDPFKESRLIHHARALVRIESNAHRFPQFLLPILHSVVANELACCIVELVFILINLQDEDEVFKDKEDVRICALGLLVTLSISINLHAAASTSQKDVLRLGLVTKKMTQYLNSWYWVWQCAYTCPMIDSNRISTFPARRAKHPRHMAAFVTVEKQSWQTQPFPMASSIVMQSRHCPFSLPWVHILFDS